jgi:hypothetical protein
MLARTAAALLLSLLLFSLAPGPVRAQSPGPALPMGMDIRKAPVGAWAAYSVKVADMPPMKQHFALVGRDADTHSVEMTSEGGMMGNAGKVVIKVVLEADPKKKDRVRQFVMQIGGNDPMQLPKDDAQSKNQFAPVDPKKLVGTKKITVPAGSFSTKQYRDKTAAGTVDVWVSDQAPPFGLVKLQGNVTQGAGEEKYPLLMELTAQGTDAKPAITKAPRPFDQQVLMGQMSKAVGAPPPPAPPPSTPKKDK